MNYHSKFTDNEKAIENTVREENDNLIGRITSNLREFNNMNRTLNTKINTSNNITEKLGEKFDKSNQGISGNLKHLTSVVKYKQGSICWGIVLFFVLLFFIRKHFRDIGGSDAVEVAVVNDSSQII